MSQLDRPHGCVDAALSSQRRTRTLACLQGRSPLAPYLPVEHLVETGEDEPGRWRDGFIGLLAVKEQSTPSRPRAARGTTTSPAYSVTPGKNLRR